MTPDTYVDIHRKEVERLKMLLVEVFTTSQDTGMDVLLESELIAGTSPNQVLTDFLKSHNIPFSLDRTYFFKISERKP